MNIVLETSFPFLVKKETELSERKQKEIYRPREQDCATFILVYPSMFSVDPSAREGPC